MQRREHPAAWLLFVFLAWAPAYPIIRLEIITHTGLPSALIGSWQELLAAAMITALLLTRPRTQPRADLVGLAILGLLLVAAFTAVVGFAPVPAIYAARLTYLPIVLYYVGRSVPLAPGGLARWHSRLAVTCVALAVGGFLLTFVLPTYWFSLFLRETADTRGWGIHAIARGGGLRMTGSLLEPIGFGTLCGWATVLCLARGSVTRGPARAGWSAGAVIGAGGALLSLSRGAWLTTVVGVVTLFGLLRYRRRLFGQIAIIAAAAGAVIVVSPDLRSTPAIRLGAAMLERTWQRTASEGNIQRERMWEETLLAVSRRPIGYGLGRVGHIGERFRTDATTPEITDGWYLKLLAEGGPLLFLAFAAVEVAVLVQLTTMSLGATSPPASQAFRVAALGLFAGSALQGLVTNLWDLYLLSHLLWLLIGLATRRDEARRSGDNLDVIVQP